MAKRGATKHLKRIAIPHSIALREKKSNTWLVRTMAGPHYFKGSVSLAVLLRDVLGFAKTMREAEQILSARNVLVDGRVRKEPKFPVGFMDIISIPKAGKTYRLFVDSHGRIMPHEIPADQQSSKLAKVVKKFTVPGKKFGITLHDGKTLLTAENIKPGDSVQISIPEHEIKGVLKLSKGVRCVVREGKRAGVIATVEEIIERKGSKRAEAKLSAGGHEFITIADYLFVVNKDFKM